MKPPPRDAGMARAMPARAASMAGALPALYAAAALRLLLPLLVLPTMAARIGADEFGRLSFILVWAGLLAMVVEGGFLAAATRLAVAADAPRRWQLAQQVFTARCVLCLPAAALAALAVRWAEPAGGSHALVDTLAIAALACSLGWPATWYLQATEQLGRWARVELIVLAVWLALCWGWAGSVEAYVALQLASTSALAVLGWRWLRRDLAAPVDAVTGAGPVAGAVTGGVTGAGRGHPAGWGAGSMAGADHPPARRLWSGPQLRAGLALGWTMLPMSIAGAAYSFALPAAASSQLSKAELGVYFLADRLVRALLGAADPVFSVVYPRIVARFASGGRAALAYAVRWAGAGSAVGLAMLLTAWSSWPLAVLHAPGRFAGFEPQRLWAVLQVLGWLWPLLLGWKFIGYWMLGSRRFDTAYRSCVIAGGIVGTAAALTVGGASGAVGLAWTTLAVELLVVALALAGIAITRRRWPRHPA